MRTSGGAGQHLVAGQELRVVGAGDGADELAGPCSASGAFFGPYHAFRSGLAGHLPRDLQAPR